MLDCEAQPNPHEPRRFSPPATFTFRQGLGLRVQVIYASQPLWAAAMSTLLLGETVGLTGAFGGALFIGACFLAATATEPDPDCGEDVCEI
mmetsp:Transcript_2248/g.4706  ORF Transcript_2248/g.4706 Transcript_2248/m.4706 type:complete len:91 (+) Transcript_2248:1571-1843(+)|eukprot:6193414-Pleurochrysis_carterae.AAC.4